MEPSREPKGKINDQLKGMGTVTADMVYQRAREIAFINGRSPEKPQEDDWRRARSEMSGNDTSSEMEEEGRSREETTAWDPSPGTTGTQAAKGSAHDEQTEDEKLVQEGLEESEHDTMIEATKRAKERE